MCAISIKYVSYVCIFTFIRMHFILFPFSRTNNYCTILNYLIKVTFYFLVLITKKIKFHLYGTNI